MRALWIGLALALPSAVCGQLPSRADMVAEQFLQGAQPMPANPKQAKELEFLNSCTARRIRASDIAYGASQDSVTQKVHAAMQQCTEDLYGKDKTKP